MCILECSVQWGVSKIVLGIHVRSFFEKELGGFQEIFLGCQVEKTLAPMAMLIVVDIRVLGAVGYTDIIAT